MPPSDPPLLKPTTPGLVRGLRPFAAWASTGSATLWLVLGVLIARLVYLAFFCPYALIEDEAHYWEWSRRLGLSYYSKGPGIAWAIAIGTALFGDTAFGVRFAAPVAGAVTMLAAAKLADLCFESKRAGFAAASLVALLPMLQFVGLVVTIDGPYVACWAIACVGAAAALLKGRRSGWLLAGAAIGVGFLFKYTILLIVPGFLIAWLWMRARSPRSAHGRSASYTPWLIGGAALAVLGLLPVGIWNATHDWVTVRHLLGHLGVAGGDQSTAPEPYRVTWTLEYLGIQLGAAGPMLFLAIYAFFSMKHASHARRQGALFCAALAFPMLAFYLLVSFFTRVEGNWTVAAYFTTAALAGFGAVDGIDLMRTRLARWNRLEAPRPRWGVVRKRPETHRQIAWDAAVLFGLLSGLGMLRLDYVAQLPVIGPVVPLGRLTSGPAVARDVEQQLETLRSEAADADPFVLAQHYGRSSLMAFYLPGQPVTYCASAHTGGRGTQYDHWTQTDLDNPQTRQELAGRSAVLLGGTQRQWERAFTRVVAIGQLPGDHKGREAFLGYGCKPEVFGASE